MLAHFEPLARVVEWTNQVARALLLEPSILILDETTSMIESSLETEILRDIRTHFPHMTLVLISHQSHDREWISSEISHAQ